MDIIDQAADHIEKEMQRALSVATYQAREGATLPSATECEDCGDAIPEARRQAVPGCVRCAACQEKHEKRARMMGHVA